MITLYGIHNCDTVKKACKWLDEYDIDYQFHDFRKDGLDKSLLQAWLASYGWEAIVNKRSTTWRQVDDETKNSIDNDRALTLILEQPTLIKRPVMKHSKGNIELGFKADVYKSLLIK